MFHDYARRVSVQITEILEFDQTPPLPRKT